MRFSFDQLGQTCGVMSGMPSSPVSASEWAVSVPAAVADLAAGAPLTPVWLNELGGITFQLGDGPARRFVKWSPPAGIALGAEVARLSWAAKFVRVPAVLEVGSDSEGSWFLTAGIPGDNAVSEHWRADPASAVAAIGAGLRELHDTAPVRQCPFDWSVQDRLADIDRRSAVLDPAGWHDDHRPLGVERALAIVSDPPPVDRRVVCHGDACAPNTLLSADGRYAGRVDLGSLGVADRWADLAVATWSTQWNYGPGWERPLLDAYGIEPDQERTAYYRLLWELGP